MRAIVFKQFGGPDVLAIEERPDPKPGPDDVLIAVKAFGINRAETYMRAGQWAEAVPISGIECVGVVLEDPSGRLAPGSKAAALMGGMGRTRPGSYAEIVAAPAPNVVPLDTDLPWERLAAIPESYATAWWAVTENLGLRRGQTLLVRGATSALGQAAVNIAVHEGAHVIATTRRDERKPLLSELGAAEVLIEKGDLSSEVRAAHPAGVDALFDLVGNSVLLDSLAATRVGGRVCQAGFLGGAAPIESFNPIAQAPSGVHFSFFGSFVFGQPGFELGRVPLQEIVDRAAAGLYRAEPSRVFAFEQIQEAHRVMEANAAAGKIVVTVAESRPATARAA